MDGRIDRIGAETSRERRERGERERGRERWRNELMSAEDDEEGVKLRSGGGRRTDRLAITSASILPPSFRRTILGSEHES